LASAYGDSLSRLHEEQSHFQNQVRNFQAQLNDLRLKAQAGRFLLTEKTMLRHLLILGSTGSGKTTHAFGVITTAFRQDPAVSLVVIDGKREYRRLGKVLQRKVDVLSIGGEPKIRFNPLAPPDKLDATHWDRAFADVFTRAYGLSEPSRRILLDSLFELRREDKANPTLRELEKQVSLFEAGSGKEQASQRSLESRLHIINTGPVGDSLNIEGALDVEAMDERVTVFEIGEVDSLRDQAFLAELLLLYLWQHDRAFADEGDEKLKRLVVVEEAHRYLCEERPPEKRGERTLLELALAEARRYGWGFVIVDQMPNLLSRYVWDNVGTVIVHRLSNMESYQTVKQALGRDPVSRGDIEDRTLAPLLLSLPEEFAVYRKYVGDTMMEEASVGVVTVPKVGLTP
jgi:DNA helicase HerA-like ATPase